MAALVERQIQSERVLTVNGLTLVASKTCSGTWHQVSGDRCDCKGFEHRGTCRHLAVALEAQQPERPVCTKCGRQVNRLFAGQCAICRSSLD